MTANRQPSPRYIATIDLRASREDYDRMVRAAKRAGLDFDEWAASILIRAVQVRRRRTRSRSP